MSWEPTGEDLEKLRSWDPQDFEGLSTFLKENWGYRDYIYSDAITLKISTGGWSGHEEAISAINPIWKYFHWQRSERGGHHLFRKLGTDRG